MSTRPYHWLHKGLFRLLGRGSQIICSIDPLRCLAVSMTSEPWSNKTVPNLLFLFFAYRLFCFLFCLSRFTFLFSFHFIFFCHLVVFVSVVVSCSTLPFDFGCQHIAIPNGSTDS